METKDMVSMILGRFVQRGFAQVIGYNKFGFVSRGASYVVVSRERGLDTKIPYRKLSDAINAVRKDPKVYTDGPSRLRSHGITHINSPLWALLHLMKLDELRE